MIYTIQIIHNPDSGKANHSKELLIEMISKFAKEIRYVSTKDEQWETFEINPEHPIFLAGGDGSIRKVFRKLIQSSDALISSSSPIILCPLGKANNIAKSLNILNNPVDKINFDLTEIEHYCYGHIKNNVDEKFFIESLGFGVFPELLFRENHNRSNNYSTQVKLQLALHKTIAVVDKIKAEKLKIKIGRVTIKGSFILAEVMKIKHMGPNLPLAHDAVIGAAVFDLVLIPEERREDFSKYLENLLMGGLTPVYPIDFIISLKASSLRIKSNGNNYHVDDQLIENYKGDYLELGVQNTKIPFVRNIQYT